MSVRTQHLAGLSVVDFSMAYAGPICGRMLGDCGADVIKIEPLGAGDGVRGNGRIFTHFNGGKRGVQIDLASTEGQQLALQLIDAADVLIENYRPGIMAKFGLDYASIKARRPDLVYCSISGFGQTGPDAQRAAYAPIAHAASGYDDAHVNSQLHTKQPTDSRPQASGIMIADMLTGAYAFGAVQTALLGRVRSGLGDHIDVTMLESMMTLIPGHQQLAQLEDAPVMGGFLPIAASDGYVMACIVSEKNFSGLCDAIDRQDLHQDERFTRTKRIPNVRFLVAEIEQWTVNRSVDECETRFNQYGIPCSRYNTAADLFTQPQLLHRGAFTQAQDDGGDYFVQNLPFQFASVGNGAQPHAPRLGEHTDEVCRENLGLAQHRIDDLRGRRVIA